MELREPIHKPGNLSCLEVRDMLSDIIDVRRGELPHPDGTRLSEAGMRAAVELHLAGCDECRQELHWLEQTGEAWSEFAVGELPPQYFEDFGSKVRARLAVSRTSRADAPAPVPPRRWAGRKAAWALSGLAAACVAFGVMRFWPSAPPAPAVADLGEYAEPPPRTTERLPPIIGPLIHAPGGVMDVMVVPQGTLVATPLQGYDSKVPTPVKNLQSAEGQFGALIFAERRSENEQPLLGAYLKTTRDVDREVIGLMVWDVLRGSPAQSMGLRKGDYIVDINGEKVNGGAEEAVQWISRLAKAGSGTPVRLLVVRFTELGPLCKPLYGTLGQLNKPEPNLPSWHF